MKRDNHYFAWGLTAVTVVCTILLFYDVVFRTSTVLEYINKVLRILAPILYGCAIAYLLSPVVNWFERAIFRHGGRKAPAKWVRAGSLVLTWIVVAAFLYGLISILAPELYKSVMLLIGNARGYYNTIYNWVLHILENNPEIAVRATELINEYYTDALTWLNDNLVPQLQTAVQAFTGGVLGMFVFFKNLLLGVIVSIYLMASKEGFAAASCKLCYTILPEDRAAWLIRGVKAADNIFSGFVRGKLLDSLIIGIICFFCSSLFEFPYAPLVSVVVGVTNIIPFFGPFLGAIPSAFLILLDTPIKSLYFILFVLVLQQFDGNILGPKILGETTGLASFWVLFSILLFGGLFGFAGMVLGVPVFAMIYGLLSRLVAYGLRSRNLPVETEEYMGKTGPLSRK